MYNEELILKFFPELSQEQVEQYKELAKLYIHWNTQINVISRKDIQNIFLNHLLHSMTIAKYVQFKEGSSILDLGTGGGLPGLPLAIFFPKTHFTLIDGRGKKIKVVQAIADAINLKNVEAKHQRAEDLKLQFDMVTSRAVAKVDKLYSWSKGLLKKPSSKSKPQMVLLKGGDLKEELVGLPKALNVKLYSLSKDFKLDYFENKYVLTIAGI